jgi:hypothetical protein
MACAQTREYLEKHYKKKGNGQFIKGQKYYIQDSQYPNCVRAFSCKRTALRGALNISYKEDKNGNPIITPGYSKTEKNFNHNTCYGKAFVNDTNKKFKNDDDDFPLLIDDDTEDKDKTDGSDIWYRDCPWYGCPSASVSDLKSNPPQPPQPPHRRYPLPDYSVPGPISNASIRDPNVVTKLPVGFKQSLDKNPLKSREYEFMRNQLQKEIGGTRKRRKQKRRFRKSRK